MPEQDNKYTCYPESEPIYVSPLVEGQSTRSVRQKPLLVKHLAHLVRQTSHWVKRSHRLVKIKKYEIEKR